MEVRAIVFDIGQTLVHYPFPLNWSELYRPAFESITKEYNLTIKEAEYEHIGNVLTKYNTRINPRETEVSSTKIFTEILDGTAIPNSYLESIKKSFYSYFCREAQLYSEVEDTLREIKNRKFLTGTLSDVAYGMDNIYALNDIKDILKYIDFPYTSNDTGYRKPSGKGLSILADKMNLSISEIIFVGDEKKDIECAHNAGAGAVLINRTKEIKEYGQEIQITNLCDILNYLENFPFSGIVNPSRNDL